MRHAATPPPSAPSVRRIMVSTRPSAFPCCTIWPSPDNSHPYGTTSSSKWCWARSGWRSPASDQKGSSGLVAPRLMVMICSWKSRVLASRG